MFTYIEVSLLFRPLPVGKYATGSYWNYNIKRYLQLFVKVEYFEHLDYFILITYVCLATSHIKLLLIIYSNCT